MSKNIEQSSTETYPPLTFSQKAKRTTVPALDCGYAQIRPLTDFEISGIYQSVFLHEDTSGASFDPEKIPDTPLYGLEICYESQDNPGREQRILHFVESADVEDFETALKKSLYVTFQLVVGKGIGKVEKLQPVSREVFDKIIAMDAEPAIFLERDLRRRNDEV